MPGFTVDSLLASDDAQSGGIPDGNGGNLHEESSALMIKDSPNSTDFPSNAPTLTFPTANWYDKTESAEDNAEDNQQQKSPSFLSSKNPENCSATLFSQWAAQCFRNCFFGGGNCNEGSSTVTNGCADGMNPLVLQSPLALMAAGSEFPLFQHMQKTKRIRTAFSPAQLAQLEQAFRRSQYLVGSERKQLAKRLMLSETQVKVWFQNRRTKSKRFFDGPSMADAEPVEEADLKMD